MLTVLDRLLHDGDYFLSVLPYIVLIVGFAVAILRYPDQVRDLGTKLYDFAGSTAGKRFGIMGASVVLQLLPSSSAWIAGKILQPLSVGLTAGGLSDEDKAALNQAREFLQEHRDTIEMVKDLSAHPDFATFKAALPEIAQKLPELLKTIQPAVPEAAKEEGAPK